MWQEEFDKKLLNRESFLYVEGTQVVRADDLKGECHIRRSIDDEERMGSIARSHQLGNPRQLFVFYIG